MGAPHAWELSVDRSTGRSGAEQRLDGASSGASAKPWDWARLGFWVALGIAAGCAGTAIVTPAFGGIGGAAFVMALTIIGVLLLYWRAQFGNSPQVYPDRPEGEGRAEAARRMRQSMLDALPEAAVLVGPDGLAGGANTSYAEGALWPELPPPGIKGSLHGPAVWFGDRALDDGGLYRLARAAGHGERASEVIQPGAHKLLASVAPAGGGSVLWRFERLDDENTGASLSDWARVLDSAVFLADETGDVLAKSVGLSTLIGERNPQRMDAVLHDDWRALAAAALSGPESSSRAVHIRGAGGAVREGVLTMRRLSQSNPAAPARFACALSLEAEDGGRDRSDAARLAEVSPLGLASLDGEDPAGARIAYASPAFNDMLGGAAEGKRLDELLHGLDKGPAGVQIASAMHRPVDLLAAASPGRAVRLSLAPLPGGRLSAHISDITEDRDLHEQAIHGRQLHVVGQLAGHVAHEFNNILQAMLLHLEILRRRHPVGDPTHVELHELTHAWSLAAAQVRKLLAFSRRQTLHNVKVDLGELLSHYTPMLRRMLGETVTVELSHGRDLPDVSIDPAHFEASVLTNLATNARDAMAAQGGGLLTISTKAMDAAEVSQRTGKRVAEGRYAVIEVADTGGGIPAEYESRILEPYFTTKEQGRGTGLGLPAVYGTIEQSGGFVHLDNRPGEGATFVIVLPEARAGEDSGEEAAAEARGGSGAVLSQKLPAGPVDLTGRGRILLVEDEAIVRLPTAMALQKLGYEVLQAENGEEGLMQIRKAQGRVDVIVSDIVMPGLSGPQMIVEARDELGDAKVIFVSGYAEEQAEVAALLQDESVSFLAKPYPTKTLAHHIKCALQR